MTFKKPAFPATFFSSIRGRVRRHLFLLVLASVALGAVLIFLPAPTGDTPPTDKISGIAPVHKAILRQPLENDTLYHPADQVSTAAKIASLSTREPDLPPELSGQFILSLYIGKNGRIDRIESVDARLNDELLKKIGAQLTDTVYQPAQIDGGAVASVIKIEYTVTPKAKPAPNKKPEFIQPPTILENPPASR